MNKISATGRVVADAEVRYSPNGDPICSFRMASDVGFGERKSTNWFSCTIWGKRGESVAPYLQKGTPVTVFGALTLREWTSKEGIKQLSPDIRIDEIDMHGSKQAGEQAAPHPAATPQRQPPRPAAAPSGGLADMSDDIPFNRLGAGRSWACI